jgi:hypothetical protein
MIAGLPKVGVTTPLGGAAQRRCHFNGGQWKMETLKHLTKPIGMFIIVLLCITVAVRAHAMNVTLAWDANSESDIAGYKIYYDTHSGPPYSNTITIPLTLQSFNPGSPQYTIQGLTDGVTYYFVTTAYDTEGLESGYSNEVYNNISASNLAPSISLLAVNGSSGSTTVYTNNANGQVGVRIVASDNSAVSQYLILDGKNDPTGAVFTGIPGGARQNADFTITNFTLNNSDGNHTIFAWVKDDQGVLSTAVSKRNVVLARTGPTVAISYSKPGPYKAGDTVVVTATLTDANSISGTPKINIDFGGTSSDIDGANMTKVTNNQWTYTMTVPPESDGSAIVTVTATDVAGNAAGAYSGNTFLVDNFAPRVKTVNNKKQVLPQKNELSVANESGFAVLLESESGINVTDPSAVTLNVSDGVNTYTRNLNDKNANGYPMVQAVPLDGSDTANEELWVVYYRSAETATANVWPYGSSVQVSVTAKDVRGNAMAAPETFTFNTETQAEHDQRVAAKSQMSKQVDQSGAVTISDPDTGTTVEFTDNLPVEPYIDGTVPLGNLSPVAVTTPVNLAPHSVFSEGADVFIPTPDQDTVSNSGLIVYGYDGEEWIPIIDTSGTDLTEGTWVLPGWNNGLSWKVVDHGNPSGIWIKVYHFSSFVAGYPVPTTSATSTPEDEAAAGAGCFISTISGK